MRHARRKHPSASAAKGEGPLAGPLASTSAEAGQVPLAAAGRRARIAVARSLLVLASGASPPGSGQPPTALARTHGGTGP